MRRTPPTAPNAARRALGAFLLLHALAHSLPGQDATNDAVRWYFQSGGLLDAVSLWTAALFWSVAAAALAAAGLALLGVPMLAGLWRRLAVVGAAASLLLFLFYAPRGGIIAPLLDLALLVGIWGHRVCTAAPGAHRQTMEVAR